MKKEELKKVVSFKGYDFTIGVSKKFDRDFTEVKAILEKEELYSVDRIKLVTIYKPSYHEDGKIEGITSYDSTATGCEFCRKMQEAAKKNPAHICGGCYDVRNENYRGANMKNRHMLNMLIMESIEFTKEELSLINTSKIGRINSSGDAPNITYAVNMLNLMYVNPYVHFAYWAKNTEAVTAAVDKVGKPENCTLVQSSPIINRPAKLAKHFDIVFTVYLEKKDVLEAVKAGAGECNGKKCMECGFKCYLNGWKKGQNVAELLSGVSKEKRVKIREYLDKKPIITNGTQKELVNYVSSKYGLTKKSLNTFIQDGRKNGLQWNNMVVNGMDITFYLAAGKMFIGEKKAA